jgi:hypothetical protein
VGIDWSTQPSDEDVQQELDGMWQQIGSRSIESLFDLPLMSALTYLPNTASDGRIGGAPWWRLLSCRTLGCL